MGRGAVIGSAVGQAVLLAALAALLYLPSLRNGFVNWDDDRVLLDNPVVARANGLGEIWSRAELPEGFPNYPLTFTTYWVEHRLWGFAPAGYHAVNLALHALATALACLVLRALGAGPWVAGCAAALFAVHPIQVESVAWVAERKNVLSAVFYLGAYLAFLRHRAGGGAMPYGLALLLFAAALLSKTATVTLPASLLLADRILRGRWERAALVRVLPMVVLGAAAAALTLHAEAEPPPVPLLERPLLAARALTFYLGQLLAPSALVPIHPRWAMHPAEPLAWLPLLAVLALAALVAARRPPGLTHWGLGHFVITLSPVLGLVPFGFTEYSFVADRHVYLASLGVFVVAALGLDWLRARRAAVATALAAALVVLLAARTLRQIAVWRDSETLWVHQLTHDPASWLARNNLAMALIAQDRLEEARPLLEAAVAARPTYAEAHNNLALVHYRRGDFAGAERHSRAAAGLKPYEGGLVKNLALVLVAQGRLAEAAVEYERALRATPDAADIRVLYAETLVQLGRPDAAREELDRALALEPELGSARALRERLPE